MFEKESEEYADCFWGASPSAQRAIKQAFQAGAVLAWNKSKENEWHYLKDGIMPEENQWVLVYDGSYTVCNYHSNTPIKWLDNYENEVYEGRIVAWKEIVLPKEIKND